MNKYKVVIVENDEDEQFFMKEGFDAAGLFEIIAQVNNGNQLLEWLQHHPNRLPDLILSDLNMPGKNGYDVITDIKTSDLYKHIPVVITSTSSADAMIQKCLNLGAAHYIIKPDTFIEYVPYAEKLHHLIAEKQWVKA